MGAIEMSAISSCISLAAFGDGETHDELAEQARIDYGALHAKLTRLRQVVEKARMAMLEIDDCCRPRLVIEWLASY